MANESLESRVTRRKHELISELHEHKRNSSRGAAMGEVERLKLRLSDLEQIVKHRLGAGWANVDASTAVQLDAWIEQ